MLNASGFPARLVFTMTQDETGRPATHAQVGFDPRRLVALPPRETTAAHGEVQAILYALGVGVSNEGATTSEALRYAYGPQLQVLPTMAVVMAWPGFWMMEPQYGIDWQRVLHAEESLELHAPLPASARVTGRIFIERIVDKGAAKGSMLYSRREIFEVQSGRHLATERRTTYLRGNGGCGDAVTPGADLSAYRSLQEPPARPPDLTVTLPTRPDQALVYRLSGDMNPLHADPQIARNAGFPAPILQGLGTFGVVGRALLRGVCEDDPRRFRRMDCRFTQPVYPGETLATDIWHEGQGHAAFRTRATERDAIVLSHGRFEHL